MGILPADTASHTLSAESIGNPDISSRGALWPVVYTSSRMRPPRSPKEFAVRFLRCAGRMIRTSNGILILALGAIGACSGSGGSDTAGPTGGSLTAGGNLGTAGVAALGGLSGLGGTGTTGGSSTIGGAPYPTGGSGNATGGGQGATGGSPGTSGGSPGTSGGSPNATGGSRNPTGGSGNPTGGNQSATGGSGNPTGGSPNATGGSPGTSGGSPNATGGSGNPTGGTQNGSGGTRNTGGTQTTNGGTTASLHSSGTYASAGAWHGYIWPAIESGSAYDPNNHTTITPTAAQGFPSGGPPFCVSGHVPATPNSLAVAMIGMNINQAQTGGATAAQWTVTGTGILVNVSNPGGSPLRLQIQTNETGAIATLWCAMLTVFDQDVIIPWDQFNTQCFNNDSGTYFDESVGISTVMVLVPGTSQAGGYDFNFCVNNMAPV